MSEPKEHPRPPQTTMLGWMILVGSVYVALMAFDSLASLRTIATTDMVAELLKEMGNPAGVSVADGVAALRVMTIVSAVCSGAAAVLGFFVLRRDRGARMALSAIAVPLALASVLTGGFVSFLVVAAIALLWAQPSRNWFAGLPPVEPPASLRKQPKVFGPRSGEQDVTSGNDRPRDGSTGDRNQFQGHPQHAPGAGSGPAPVVGQTPSDARPVQGFGAAPQGNDNQGHAPQTHASQAYAQNPYLQHQHVQQSVAGPRPKRVLVAAVITFVFAGLALLSCLVTMAVALAADEAMLQDLLDQQQVLADQGITAADLGPLLALTSGILGFLSLLAIAAAGLMLAGNQVGRVMLVMVTSGVLAFSVFGLLTSPLLMATALAAGVTLFQVTRPDVNAWFRAKR